MDHLTPTNPDIDTTCSVLFTLEDKPGALDGALRVFKQLGISLKFIESRPSKNFEWEYEFIVDIDVQKEEILQTIKSQLCKVGKNVGIMGSTGLNSNKGNQTMEGMI